MEKGAAEKGGKKGKREIQWTTGTTVARPVGPFSASRPPLSLGTWFPSFPFSSFASYLSDPLLVPSSSSPRVRHFCLYFVVIVNRKRTSAPWKMAAVALPVRERSPLPPPPRSSLPSISTTDALVLGEMRFIRPILTARSTFLLFTTVLSDFGHRPASEPWPFDTTRYMCSWRLANLAFCHSSVSHPVVFDCSDCHSRLPRTALLLR